MADLPRLYTPRLCLRPWTLADAPRLQELAGDKRIAATTASVPHPYPDGAAEEFLRSLPPRIETGADFVWAITLAGTRTPGREAVRGETGHVIGSIGVGQQGDPVHRRGCLGYWIGVPYWNKGFATEAGRAVLRYVFGRGIFQRVVADHFGTNPASGRVMVKLGMTYEGTRRRQFNKWGEFLDVVNYGILAEEWAKQKPRRRAVSSPALALV